MPDEPIEPAEHRKLWKERPAVIGRFLAEHPHYEYLCAEVAYILEKRLKAAGLEFSAVTYRAKSLESFVEKIIRKEYKDPFSEITDFAGVRVVYLYSSDFPRIEQIIRAEFNVIEKVDKIKEQGADKFGYGAVHFVVTLGQKSSGARYDDLKGLICEIQVRTVSQDAWAIIEHHLVYKQESAVPEILRRRLNRLSAFFEDADETFDRIRTEREAYIRQVESKFDKKSELLDQEINLDTVRALLKLRFPDIEIEYYHGHLSNVLKEVDIKKYSKLANLDKALSRTKKAREAYLADSKLAPSAARELLIALMFDDVSIFNRSDMPQEILKSIEKYAHLVER
jgi:ppGpp synthetase/RelA/SpoT-type nucleotidyltranferase